MQALLPGGTSGDIFTSMPMGKDARIPMCHMVLPSRS